MINHGFRGFFFFSLFAIVPRRVSNICKNLIWEKEKLRHLKKFVITNIEKPILIREGFKKKLLEISNKALTPPYWQKIKNEK